MSKYKKMKQLIADMRLPEYRYKQLLDAVFLQGIMRFEDMKLLPIRFNPIQSNDSYGNYGALKPHTNKGLLPYHS